MDIRRRVIDRFRVIVLHHKGLDVKEISERTGIHPRTVRRILDTGKVFPAAYEKVIRDIEKFPFASVEERASRLGISKGYVSRMYGLVFFSDRSEGEEWMAEYLVRVGLYDLSAGLLRILPFSYRTYSLISSLPEEYLTPHLRILKLYGDVRFNPSGYGRDYYDRAFRSLMERLRRDGYHLSYYHALYTYMNVLMLQSRWRDAYDLALSVERDPILLPPPLSLNLYALIGKLAITLGYSEKFRELLSRLRHKLRKKKTFVHLRKKVVLDLIIADGKYSQATRYSLRDVHEPDATLFRCILLLQTGRFREVIREDVSHVEVPLYRFYTSVLKGYARLVLGYVSNALNDVGKSYRKVEGFGAAESLYCQFMAFYEARTDRYERSEGYLRRIVEISGGYGVMGRVSRALINRNTSFLSDFSRENLLRLVMDGRTGDALDMARRYGMLFDLIYLSTLAGKPLRVNFAR